MNDIIPGPAPVPSWRELLASLNGLTHDQYVAAVAWLTTSTDPAVLTALAEAITSARSNYPAGSTR